MGTNARINIYRHNYCRPEQPDDLDCSIWRTAVFRRFDSFPKIVYKDLSYVKRRERQRLRNTSILDIASYLINKDGYYPSAEVFRTATQTYELCGDPFDYIYTLRIKKRVLVISRHPWRMMELNPQWTLMIEEGVACRVLLPETDFEDIKLEDLEGMQ